MLHEKPLNRAQALFLGRVPLSIADCRTVTVSRVDKSIREELELKCLPLPFHCHDPRRASRYVSQRTERGGRPATLCEKAAKKLLV